MWTADSRHSAKRKYRNGFTALEILVSMVVLAVMALVVERAFYWTTGSQRMLHAMSQATQRGHEVSYEIRELVSSSRRLFFGDDVGNDYLDALDLGGVVTLSASRLPVVDESGRLEPDTTGDPRTGNALLFVVESNAVPAVADPSAGTIRHIDVYRFVYVYPTETSRYLVAPETKMHARDLGIWKSVPFVNYQQLMGITDAGERQSVLSDLANRFGFTTAWDPAESVSRSFYGIDAGGSLAATPEMAFQIAEDLDLSRGGRLVHRDCQLARTDIENYHRRPVFTVDDPATWKPDGFEVKVVGSSGSRLVWVRVVVEAAATGGLVATHASTVTASVRDL